MAKKPAIAERVKALEAENEQIKAVLEKQTRARRTHSRTRVFAPAGHPADCGSCLAYSDAAGRLTSRASSAAHALEPMAAGLSVSPS
jgi:hypothetical protein